MKAVSILVLLPMAAVTLFFGAWLDLAAFRGSRKVLTQIGVVREEMQYRWQFNELVWYDAVSLELKEKHTHAMIYGAIGMACLTVIALLLGGLETPASWFFAIGFLWVLRAAITSVIRYNKELQRLRAS